MQCIRQNLHRGFSTTQLREQHAAFADAYPKLFETVCKPDADLPHLEYLLGMLDQVQNKNTTYESASQTVGQHMFDHFVRPNLPPQQQQ